MKIPGGLHREEEMAIALAMVVVAVWSYASLAFTYRVVKDSDPRAYCELRPTAETLKFRRTVAGVYRARWSDGRQLYGWRARNLVRHIRFSGWGEFCTCGSMNSIEFYDAMGKSLATAEVKDFGIGVWVRTAKATEFYYLDAASEKYFIGQSRHP